MLAIECVGKLKGPDNHNKMFWVKIKLGFGIIIWWDSLIKVSIIILIWPTDFIWIRTKQSMIKLENNDGSVLSLRVVLYRINGSLLIL